MTLETARIAPSDEQVAAINTYAQKYLKKHLLQHEKSYGSTDYEWKFIGDLFARMILASYMGYHPEDLGADAVAAGERLIRLAGAEND